MKTYQNAFLGTLFALSLAACSSTGMNSSDNATGGSSTGTVTAAGTPAAAGNSNANGTGQPGGGASATSGTSGH